MAVDFRQVPAFCINLDTRPQRWELAQAEFARVRWPVARWPAIVHAQSPSSRITPGHAGCLDSHRQLWRKCLDEQIPVMAVLEDDVVLPSDFIDIFGRAAAELPPDWALWHLHSTKARVQPAGEYLVRILSRMWGTHGYFIRPFACEALLSIPDYEPVDYRMTDGYLRVGGQPFGTALRWALGFQRGADTDIPESAQLQFWREQRVRYCR